MFRKSFIEISRKLGKVWENTGKIHKKNFFNARSVSFLLEKISMENFKKLEKFT